jgi:hypothetical protein
VAEYLPKFPEGGNVVTFTASAAVTGGTMVSVSGDRTVATAAAKAAAIGVAGDDAAQGQTVAVRLAGPVERVAAAAAITAGAQVEAAAGGKIQTFTDGPVLGVALTAADNADDLVEFVRN